MNLKRHLTGIALAAISMAFPASALAEWTRTYVVEWNEPAMYYGAKSGVIDPGTDCPKGSNPELDWVKVMMKAGYTEAEAKWLRDPANPTRSPVNGQNQMAFRGKDRANVYTQPWTYPDPGLTGVSGDITEGINLDGNAKTGFTSPTGDKGVDNTFYRTLGCWKTYRGPERLSSGSLQFNDSMRNGSWTQVIVVHGAGNDPMNDSNVDVGIYMSADKMVKDGNGGVSSDFTFKIMPHARFEATFKGKSKNGRITAAAPDDVMLRDPGYRQELDLKKAQIDFTMKADGALRGYVGGYRAWEPVYQGWVNGRGPVIESLTWVDLPGVWYALKRNADYAPVAGGEKTHISYALRIEALPAFVMNPDGKSEATKVVSYKTQADPATAKPQVLNLFLTGGVLPDRGQKLTAGPDAPLNVPANYNVKTAP